MGTGRLKNGKYDVTVVGNFALTAAEWADWERALKKASEIMFDASDGQLEFGTFYVCDEGIGLDTADFILYDAGDPSYNTGTFGNPGAAMHLMPYVKNAVLTVLHEWGHHAWGLGEEYSGPLLSDVIDDSNPAPDNSTIPIVDTGRAVDELVALQASAILKFGTAVERRTVTANTATTVTVNPAFPDLPTNNDYSSVFYQTPAECADVAGADFCIMEKSRTAAGAFDATGTWVPAANPVTEFCTSSNHDSDGDTAQEDANGTSCWEQITSIADYAGLTTPDPAAAGPTAGFTVPDWVVLDKQPRFALVLDRSGSMASGNKMLDAQHGAVYWLEFCAEGSDRLAVIWYDHAIERILDLTQVDALPSLDPTTNAINALTPRGATNIRDGLFEGLDQIQTPVGRSAVQVVLLLTDGKHNTPIGSNAAEVLSDYQTGGVRIYSLGVGTPATVDMDLLDELAADTGGKSYAVGDDNPGEVETAMVEINAEVRGGIVTTHPDLMPDMDESPLRELQADPQVREGRRPPLKEILRVLGIDSLKRVLRPDDRLRATLLSIPAEIEERSGRASFTLVYPPGNDLWLYLIDPNGDPLDMTGPQVHHVVSEAPHEFAIVDRPQPGRWFMVAVRPLPGPSFGLRAVAGCENRNLQVFGGAPPLGPVNTPVRIWATARWHELLSDLTVTAVITDPSGGRHRLILRDETATEPNSGEYAGLFVPNQAGRHQGVVTVRSRHGSTMAKHHHRLLHAEEGADAIHTRVEVPQFVRLVRFYFDVGDRPEIRDEEALKGLPERYQSPRKCDSRPEPRAPESQP